ncbi:MAG: envelope fusion protein [Candidatus Thiodiazotropha endolucinida]|nr:envelope fusion protein [Candidatus Thiodiazotropha endolucinida]
MRVPGLVAVFMGLTGSVIINENVIFQKTNEVTITHAKWLASFVIDLEPFNGFLDKLGKDISIATVTADTIISKYFKKGKEEYWTTLYALQKEVVYLNETRNYIIEGLREYKLLPHREKRSLLPIIGEAAGWLFGLVTESDLANIRKNIKNLAANQRDIMHVVHESISLINVSRTEIAENRQAIADLLLSVHALDKKLEILIDDVRKQMHETKYFLGMYLKLDLITMEIKDMVQNAMFYLEHLRTQLNFLSLGKLNPSTLSPSNLRSLLLEIRNNLPTTLALISDPTSDLWLFYRRLQTSALLFDSKIVVIVHIPLLEVNNQFDVYQVFSLPIVIPSMAKNNGFAQSMTAMYRLESDGFLINKARTKYALLTNTEAGICSNPAIKYCNVQSPIYPVNLARLCVINLLLQKQDAVKRNCESIVSLNTKLPLAVKLMEFLWGIVSQVKLRFSIVCKNQQTKTFISKAPIDILEVPMACVASNDHFTLVSSYHTQSEFQIRDHDLALLRSINISKINVLNELRERYPNFTKIPLPKSLKPIKQISLGGLMNALDGTQEISVKDDAWPNWVYFGIGSGIMGFIILSIYVYKKYNVRIKQSCSSLRENCCVHETVITKPGPGVSTTIDDQKSDCGGPSPSAPGETRDERVEGVTRLYPSLFTEDTRL